MPEGVLSRAREISAFLSDNDFMQENKNIVANEGGSKASGAKLLKSLNKLEDKPVITEGEEEVLRKLRSIIPEKISPFEACSLLFELKELLQ